MLTVGSRIVSKVVDLDYEGQGVIKHEGVVIFVKGLIDEEVAEVEITQLKKNFGQGKIVQIIEKSPHRITHHFKLGSLDLLHLSPLKQLQWQIKTTKESFKKIAGIDVEIKHIISNQQTNHYRNKTVYHVMNEPFLTLGLYDDTNSELMPVSDFILADHKTNEILKYLSLNKVLINPEVLKHIIFRTNLDQEVLITLVALERSFLGKVELVEKLKKIPKVKGITLNIKDNPKNILGKESIVLYGDNRIIERIGSYELMINDRSFFQVNLPVITDAYQLIKDKLNSNLHVIDAYSGIGSIGFFISDKTRKVTMIESNPEATEMANLVKEKYHLEHVDVILGRAEEIMKHLSAEALILDPPRNGLMPELITEILSQNYQQIFYLSCDVKTLARDIKLLNEKYEILEVVPIRMFFHTTELETLVMLKNKQILYY